MNLTEHLDVFKNVITYDETWIFSIWSKSEEAINALEDTHFTKNEKKNQE
jgi:hypothetical protein